MAIPKIQGSQRDFSSGEVDVSLKRGDDTATWRSGARQMSNWRIKNTRSITNRPGRTALFLEPGRVEKIKMAPSQYFYLAFGDGYLKVYNAAGAEVFNTTVKGDGTTAIPWTAATAKRGSVDYDLYRYSVYICYSDSKPTNVPQVLTWDGVSQTSTWTIATYDLFVYYGFQYRTPFYKLSPDGIFIWTSDSTGSVTVTASAPVFVAGIVGTRIRMAYHQLLITAFTDSMHVTASWDYIGPGLFQVSWAGSPGPFQPGQIVNFSPSGAECVIVATDVSHIYTLQLNNVNVSSSDTAIAGPTAGGPTGTLTVTAVAYSSITTSGVSIWDDEVMNNFRGWPTSIFVDQGRLGFCNFPSVPSLIAWSAFGLFQDQYTDPQNATPINAIQEIAPAKSAVQYVTAGMESSEFVFCDNAVYYIPITVQNPLAPGSVQFTQLSRQGSVPNIKPRAAEQTVIYMEAGGAQVGAVQAPGAYYRPFIVEDISEMHAHLFADSPVVAIAIPPAPGQFSESYIYLLREDGTMIMGKYSVRNGLIEVGQEGRPKVGWLPWNGGATVSWAAALDGDLIMVSSYAPNSITPVTIVEALDANQYLDAALAVNSVPTALTPPGGKGPLWWIPGGTVNLIDNGTRMMGTYDIDANGFIVPQFNAGEDLTSSALIAGQPWTAVLEPFSPIATSGQDLQQRMRRRRVSRMAAYVINSTGFLLARLFSGPITPTSPALGTIMNNRRVATWNQGDDPTLAPPLREEVQEWRPIGRSYDPRVALIKDTPGPLEVAEMGLEVSI